MTQAPLLVWGEALADLAPEPGDDGRYRALLGGSGFNTALALARCGAPTALAASLSADAIGWRFRSRLEQEGILTGALGASTAPTPLAMIEPIAADGVASYGFHLADTALAQAPPLPASPGDFAHLHLTSFGATLGAAGVAAGRLVPAMRAAGVSVSYDLNIRSPAFPDRDAALNALAVRIAGCDLVKFSAEDEGWLGAAWLGSAIAACKAPPLLLRTDGAGGARLSGPGGLRITVAAPPVVVVDTIGAGDAFMGAFLAALARRGLLGPKLRDAGEPQLASAMGFAAEVAAATCAVRGCDPPRIVAPAPE